MYQNLVRLELRCDVNDIMNRENTVGISIHCYFYCKKEHQKVNRKSFENKNIFRSCLIKTYIVLFNNLERVN